MQKAMRGYGTILATGVAILIGACGQAPSDSAGDGNDIWGRVTSTSGPEAGVWVIAETDDLGTRFARIVVTDDDGRYLVPELPDADYTVWVRGYGLADSTKVRARPGDSVDLTATIARDAAEAAKVYPAAYWYAMMHIPPESETHALGGGRNEYLMGIKNMGCVGCHQLGQLSTRTLPDAFSHFDSEELAWMRRVSSGQAGPEMMEVVTAELGGVAINYLADWTRRIANGELPQTAPERPSGPERNVVATIRDWATPKAYMHDLTGTDRREPTVNGYGRLYGAAEFSTDFLPILDPVANTDTTFHATPRDADTPTTHDMPVLLPSAYWGDERIWDSKVNAHNPMLDQDGRVWYTARIRAADNPDFCKAGSDHPSAQYFSQERSGRQLGVYLPETGEFRQIDTCFGTHHLQFAYDSDNTLWVSSPGGHAVGWLKTNEYLATGDAAAAQGWTPVILDTNGNGRPDAWTEPGEPIDPTKDARVQSGYYAVMPHPTDPGVVWGSRSFRFPGELIRLELGDNPPYTTLGEIYRVPLPGFGIRGADIDTNGVIWVSLGSGHLGEFDRSKCKGPLNGPAATGDHCPEGWTFHDLPGPAFPDEPDRSVESTYYTWVDQHNTLGLGANVPMVTANLFDGVHAFVDGEWVTIRIPYPLGFYAKGFEGRTDDPDARWKGRGLWVPSGDRTPWLKENGVGSRPLVVHFQMRPDPLAD